MTSCWGPRRARDGVWFYQSECKKKGRSRLQSSWAGSMYGLRRGCGCVLMSINSIGCVDFLRFKSGCRLQNHRIDGAEAIQPFFCRAHRYCGRGTADLTQNAQVLFFTHHCHLVELARSTAPCRVATAFYTLGR